MPAEKAPLLTDRGTALDVTSSGGVELETHLARPQGRGPFPAVLMLHGFPSGTLNAEHVGNDLQELADRVASEMGWMALAVRMRGCGTSRGDFSLSAWVDDAAAALAALRRVDDVGRIWIAGFGTGGAIGLEVAASDPEVAGVALVATPADFDDWAQAPDLLLAHAREAGAIRDAAFPPDVEAWNRELSTIRASSSAEAFSPRPLLVLHGSDDPAVPQFDARMIADAHGDATLRIIAGAGHQLRHDPRAIAVLLGWLDREHNIVP